METKPNPIERLERTQYSEDYDKELTFEFGEEKLICPVSFRQDQKNRDVFNVSKVLSEKGESFLKCKKKLIKRQMIYLIIKGYQYTLAGGELKKVPGPKEFILCQVIDIRTTLIKVKILL
ncbi:MAG TPA: hypothetical protein PLO44_00225 [Candidatus Paceibacterota bacterium]|nr:hypothetical protein [Candidatus Paceibacterota bacterium]